VSSGRVLPQRYVSITSSRELLHSFSRPCRVRSRVITKMWIVCREGSGYSNCAFDAGFVTQLAKTLTIHRGYLRRCRQPVIEAQLPLFWRSASISLRFSLLRSEFRPLRNLHSLIGAWCSRCNLESLKKSD